MIPSFTLFSHDWTQVIGLDILSRRGFFLGFLFVFLNNFYTPFVGESPFVDLLLSYFPLII